MPTSSSTTPIKDLESILRQTLGNDLTIVKVDTKNLTDPGENYGSLILAVNATVVINSQQSTLNLVAKMLPSSSWLQKLFNSSLTFKKELQFYRDITPECLKLQRENGVIEPEKMWLGAKFYGGRLGIQDADKFDEQAAIVLENLNYSGYAIVDRMIGLSKKQAEFAVKKLAKLHALIIAMRLKKPKIFESVVLPALGAPANATAKTCLIKIVDKAVQDLKKIPEAAPYLDKVNKTIEYIGEALEALQNEKKGPWATLVHGDFWCNNMMFKNDENGEILDMKIVDFQLGIYDCGINDLVFFLISSPTWEVIDNDFDHLVGVYYESFVDILKSLDVDTADYGKKEFMELLDKYATLRFGQCLMMTQVIKSKPGSAPKMENISNEDHFLSIGGGEVYLQKMLHTVQFFDKRGWLKK